MATATDLDLIRIHGQCHEIMKRIANGSLNESNVRKALQYIIEGKFPEDARFDRYADKLVSVFDWLARLRDYNVKYWDNRFTDEDFAAAEAQLALVPADYVQGVNGVYGFHVEFSSVQETIEMWFRVYQGELPDAWLWPELKFDAEHFRLHELARTYTPGFHLVCINLTAHWEPEAGRTIDEVREAAKESGEILAQLEVISIYGVLTELFMEQNGTDLPYSDMPGTELSVPGRGAWRSVLCIYWRRDRRQGKFSAGWAGYRHQHWAAPVIRELQH